MGLIAAVAAVLLIVTDNLRAEFHLGTVDSRIPRRVSAFDPQNHTIAS